MAQDDEPRKDPSGRKLQKVKRDGDEWQFSWAHGSEVHSLKASQAAAPELSNALAKLLDAGLEALPVIDKQYHKKTRVHGVLCDWKGDDNRRNAEILLHIDQGQDAYIKIKSPKKLASPEIQEAKKPRWDRNTCTLFDILEQEAFEYIDGKRAQIEAPLVEKEEPQKGLFDGKSKAKKLDKELKKSKAA